VTVWSSKLPKAKDATASTATTTDWKTLAEGHQRTCGTISVNQTTVNRVA